MDQRSGVLVAGLVVALGLAWGAPAAAQPPASAPAGARPLSLEEALQLIQRTSEPVAAAEAQVAQAEGDRQQARSERWPQLSTGVAYTRTLRSEFEDISFDFGDDSGGEDDLGDLPFGQENQYNLDLNLQQTLFAGGRLGAQDRAAKAGVAIAREGLRGERARAALQVVEAYFDASLFDRLVRISEATLQQAERAYEQTRVAREVGNVSEFDLLRAQVARDNERPSLIQRRADRDLTHLRLKQLLELPLDQPLVLTTDAESPGQLEELIPIDEESVGVTPEVGAETPVETIVEWRTAVMQGEQSLRIQEELVRMARAQRWPSLGLSSDYGRVAYPASGVPGWDDTRTNWTVRLGARLPLFTGGRIRGEEAEAKAAVDEAQARLKLVRELALLDVRDAQERLRSAEAVWEASQGTVEQARKAYEIAEIRYREGISTQLELTDARLLLAFAEGNRALAARNLQVARARVALLPDLPLDAGGAPVTPAAFGITTVPGAGAAGGSR